MLSQSLREAIGALKRRQDVAAVDIGENAADIQVLTGTGKMYSCKSSLKSDITQASMLHSMWVS